MNWQAWYTVGVVVLVFATLVRGIAPPDMVVMAGAVLVALAGVITPEDVLQGFSNDGMLTVAALFVVAAGLRETGGLDRLSGRLMGSSRNESGALLQMGVKVSALSAFLNNTAVVAMLIPVVTDWCRKQRISPSRILIPLSYFTILGGTCTLIGTSTNLVVNGLMADTQQSHHSEAVRQSLYGMSLFELAWVGVPCATAGTLYLMLVARRLLPDNRDLLEQLGETARNYLIEMVIHPGCTLIGKRVQQAGLRQLPGLFLIEIVREGRVMAPVEPDEVLEVGDRLSFAGVVSTIVDLERIPGLVPASDDNYETRVEERRQRRYCEAVISSSSPLIGRNIRDANFRAAYNAAVVAVHRGQERLAGRIGDIVLRAGDTLLLQTGAHFAQANRNNPDFYLVSSLEEARPVRHERAWVSLALLGLLILLLANETERVPIVLAAFLVSGLMIVSRCISATDARRSVQWDVLITIAGSFSLGIALEKSGAAAALAHFLVDSTRAWGPVATLAVVYGVTMVFTELITNNAAAVLLYPLGIATAEQLGVDARPFAIAICMAASASFATPIGYQTNLMVYGPGGYRFSDFLRVGVPMNVLLWIVSILVIPIVWPLKPV